MIWSLKNVSGIKKTMHGKKKSKEILQEDRILKTAHRKYTCDMTNWSLHFDGH